MKPGLKFAWLDLALRWLDMVTVKCQLTFEEIYRCYTTEKQQFIQPSRLPGMVYLFE